MIPENIQLRENYIYNQVLNGLFDARWVDIVKSTNGRTIRLRVMEDALRIDDVRVNVTAVLAQKLADIFDASLPTAMVADMMFAAAVRRAAPCPVQISTSTASMIKHSQSVDKQLKNQGTTGLVATCGKHWVLDKKLESKPQAACNYGWHFNGSSFQGIKGFSPASSEAGHNVRVIQPNTTGHDALHVDYSQICQLVSQTCWIDNVEMKFSDILKDPAYADLVSHQGALNIDRQPGTVPITGTIVLLPTYITIGDSDANV